MRAIGPSAADACRTQSDAACAQTSCTHAAATTKTARTHASASAAASIRRVHRHRDRKHCCYGSSANMFERHHRSLLLSRLTKTR
jgi:hypothetical protein